MNAKKEKELNCESFYVVDFLLIRYSKDIQRVMCMQERIPVQEVFEQLQCSRDGLSTEEGQKRLQIFGPNKLEEKKAISIVLCVYFPLVSININ